MIDAVQEPLLVVEDSNEDFRMLQRLMQRFEVKNPIYRCSDGDEVLNYLYHKGAYNNPRKAPRPSVILLDLNLPGVDGRYVLEKIKQDVTFREIPIVVFTTSSNPEDIELCYQKGANGYLVKPMDYKELHNIMRAFVNYWLEANVAPVIKY
jgi:CheY-like chemotaxis protein